MQRRAKSKSPQRIGCFAPSPPDNGGVAPRVSAQKNDVSQILFCFVGAYRRAMEHGRCEELALLGRASLTDNLTDLGNHRAYQEDLPRELARIERHGGTLSLAMLDVDNFKGVNDRMGHVHGDHAKLLRARLPDASRITA